jgi:hypothetical protein
MKRSLAPVAVAIATLFAALLAWGPPAARTSGDAATPPTNSHAGASGVNQ